VKKWRAGAALTALIGIAAIGFGSCSTLTAGTPSLNDKLVKKADFAGPEDSTLVYGFVGMPGFLSTAQIPTTEFAQINPAVEPALLSPGKMGTFFYFQPVPKGSELHLVYYSYTSGRTTYYSYEGIQKGLDLDIQTEKAGLHYAGSYLLTSLEKGGFFSMPKDYGFHPTGKETELDALKKLLSKFKGTAWEPVILARMEELNETK